MPLARVTFLRCKQDSQDFGSDDDHMVSRVFFDLEIDGHAYPELYVDVKQPVGESFEKGPLEVGNPHGYSGPFNYASFRAEVEGYYRSLAGSAGGGIRFGPGQNLRMRDNLIEKKHVVEFEVKDKAPGW